MEKYVWLANPLAKDSDEDVLISTCPTRTTHTFWHIVISPIGLTMTEPMTRVIGCTKDGKIFLSFDFMIILYPSVSIALYVTIKLGKESRGDWGLHHLCFAVRWEETAAGAEISEMH